MTIDVAIDVCGLTYDYGKRRALQDVTFQVPMGEIFALLGPNGGGKTTLFRILSTLVPPQQGEARLMGWRLPADTAHARSAIGVVFQAPSLDKKLTVVENLQYQGKLYGMSGPALARRIDELLSRVGLTDRRGDRTETLSGGLRRRVELAKAMLHEPRLLLMDEPSTGLDPGARMELSHYLQQLREQSGVTVVLTTHLFDEAEKADRMGIMHEGSLVALDTPAALRATVGGESIFIVTDQPHDLATSIAQRFACETRVIDQQVRLEQPNGHEWVPRLVEAFPGRIQTITLGRPTLEDVFIARTGHRFGAAAERAGGYER